MLRNIIDIGLRMIMILYGLIINILIHKVKRVGLKTIRLNIETHHYELYMYNIRVNFAYYYKFYITRQFFYEKITNRLCVFQGCPRPGYYYINIYFYGAKFISVYYDRIIRGKYGFCNYDVVVL